MWTSKFTIKVFYVTNFIQPSHKCIAVVTFWQGCISSIKCFYLKIPLTLLLFIRIVKNQNLVFTNQIQPPNTFIDASSHFNLWSVLMMLVKNEVVKILLIPFLQKTYSDKDKKNFVKQSAFSINNMNLYLCCNSQLEVGSLHSLPFQPWMPLVHKSIKKWFRLK